MRSRYRAPPSAANRSPWRSSSAPVKAPRTDSEELTLEQRLGNITDLVEKRLRGAWTEDVDESCKVVLADAVLSKEEDRDIRVDDQSHLANDVLHRR